MGGVGGGRWGCCRAQVAELLPWPVGLSRDPGFWVETVQGGGRSGSPEDRMFLVLLERRPWAVG